MSSPSEGGEGASPVRSSQRPDAVRFSDFRCPICLDLLYKPCAPAAEHCSHAFCFWCLHSAMSPVADSRCPLDRGRFSHQPAVAAVLHRALARLFPAEYRRRARETREEEEASRTRSQAVDGDDDGDDGEDGEEEEEEEGGEEGRGGGELPRSSSSSSLPPTSGAASAASSSFLPLSPDDFRCSRPGCGKLLLDPVVLNCGDAVCGCGRSEGESESEGGGLSASSSLSSCVPSGRQCPACGGAGRVGGSRPRTCSLLAGLIESLFPSEVAERRRQRAEEEAREGGAKRESGSEGRRERGASATTEAEAAEAAAAGGGGGGEEGDGTQAPAAPPPPQPQPQRRPSSLDTHFGIGCDACGAYPLRGRRFRCLDCAAATAVGYDLCGDCFDDEQRRRRQGRREGEDGREAAVRGSVDGRFAQGHRPSHRVEEVPLRPGLLHRIADAHPELSMEQVLRLTQLALGRDDDDGDGGERERGDAGDADDADGAEEEEEEPSDEDGDAGEREERAAARERRAEGRRQARTARPTSVTVELELDPSRLPEGFPFRTVPELEAFFELVERAGPGNLPAAARETMARWFPSLATFLEEHAGGEGPGGGGGGGGEEEEEEGAGAAAAAAAAGETAGEDEVERS